LYRAAPDQVRDAAYHRAQAMVYSDQWVNEGRVENSPLLAQVEDELIKSYTALRNTLGVRSQPTLSPGAYELYVSGGEESPT
jgi:hypothetical protein